MNVATNIDKQFYELYLSFRIMPNTRGLGGYGEISGLGEFGEALGEIASLSAFAANEITGATSSALGELNELALTVEEAKTQLSQALNLKAQVANIRARFDRLTQKLSRAKNETVRTKIQGLLAKAKPLIDTAAAGAGALDATISSMSDFLKNAGVAVEELKKKVVETAAGVKKGIEEKIQQTKELAVKAGQFVLQKKAEAEKLVKQTYEAAKQKAAEVTSSIKKAAEEKIAHAKALTEQARQFAEQKREQLKQAALQKAAQLKAEAEQLKQAALQKAEQLRQAALQKAAQARAAAQAAARAAAQRVHQAAVAARATATRVAQQVAQAAAARVQQARAAVAPVVQRVQAAAAAVRAAPSKAVSTVKSWFGLKGLSGHRGLAGLGIAPILLYGGLAAGIISAIGAANLFMGQGEAAVEEVPATIPLKNIEKYKDVAGECYNSAVAQGYDVTTKAKSDYLEKICRERASAQMATEIPTVPSGYEVPSAPGYYPEGGTPMEQMCAADPTNPQCVTQLPTGGGYYTAGERPTVMTVEEYQAQQRAQAAGYAPIVPTYEQYAQQAVSQGYQAPSYEQYQAQVAPTAYAPQAPGYEPGYAPEFAPSAPAVAPIVPTYEQYAQQAVSQGYQAPSYEQYQAQVAPTAYVPAVPSIDEEFKFEIPFLEPQYPEYVAEPQYPGLVPTEVSEKIDEEYMRGDIFYDIFGSETQPQIETTEVQIQSKSKTFSDIFSEVGL